MTLFTTLVLGFFLLTPGELASLGRTIAATAGFVSNMVFWQDTGYFDTAAESKPLLHTWSLAVEEQFYVLWPLVLLLISKTRLGIRFVLAAVMALSFAASCYAAVVHPPSAFFLLPARAWELLVGAALSLGLAPLPRTTFQRNAVALVGLTMVLAGCVLIDRQSVFPGWNALYPCVGAALLIAAGEQGSNVVARQFLARSPMVFIGLISYSLYLWHWPLLSLARITQRGSLTGGQAAAVIAVAFGLSVLTWRFVERPLRAKGHTPAAAPVLMRYALVSVAALIVGVSIYRSNGFVQFARPEIVRTEIARFSGNPLSHDCLRWQAETGPLAGERCMTGQDEFPRRLVIWGDSHADSVAPGVVRYATDRAYGTYQLTMAGCPPLVDVDVEGPGGDYRPCRAFNRRVVEYIATDPSVDVVMLAARWTLYTENARFGHDDPGPITYLIDRYNHVQSSEGSKQAFSRALEATIRAVRAAGKKVIVLGTIPPLGVNVPECLARNHMPFSGVRECGPDAQVVRSHLRYADSEIERLVAKEPGACTLPPQSGHLSRSEVSRQCR